MLAKHKILSAPLVMSPGLEDMEGEGIGAEPSGPTLLGWIDIADILRGLLHRECVYLCDDFSHTVICSC